MEIELTPEPGATAAETAIIERVQRKELDERFKAQFLNGIDIRIRQRVMSREAETFDEALKAAISEETIESLTAHPRGIMRTVRESDKTSSQEELAQLTSAMEDLKAKMDGLIRNSPRFGSRDPISRRNHRGGYTPNSYNNNPNNNPHFRRNANRSNSPNRRGDRPFGQSQWNLNQTQNQRSPARRNGNPSDRSMRNDSPGRREPEGERNRVRFRSQHTEENRGKWKGNVRSVEGRRPRSNSSKASRTPPFSSRKIRGSYFDLECPPYRTPSKRNRRTSSVRITNYTSAPSEATFDCYIGGNPAIVQIDTGAKVSLLSKVFR
ncbi:serine/arginine repetitive matrix protein 5-like [Centruroides vittatus]|uniref:serine/arginine repetitive matrix protein 5-like n=1 Tax=Centruroides vittatus TaxID=120091 RepID=UPI003510BEEB